MAKQAKHGQHDVGTPQSNPFSELEPRRPGGGPEPLMMLQSITATTTSNVSSTCVVLALVAREQRMLNENNIKHWGECFPLDSLVQLLSVSAK